jgi:hypothetical protein
MKTRKNYLILQLRLKKFSRLPNSQLAPREKVQKNKYSYIMLFPEILYRELDLQAIAMSNRAYFFFLGE